MIPGTPTLADRLAAAIEMMVAGEEMMQLTLARRHPTLSPLELDAKLVEWLCERSGAPDGDAEGVPIDVRQRFG